jgi:uracil-DNA glycosylase
MTIALPVESPEARRRRESEIAALHARIVACRACESGGFVPSARPIRHPWTDRQRTMIVGQGRPSPTELGLCRPFLADELRLVQPRIVLAIGGMAIEHFLGRASLDSVVGTMAEVDGRRILPLPHPSGVSRWLNEPAHQHLVERALALLAQSREDLGL